MRGGTAVPRARSTRELTIFNGIGHDADMLSAHSSRGFGHDLNRFVILLSIVLPALVFWLGNQEATQNQPALESKPTFVSSETCKSCHAERHETWLKTAHAYSLREPSVDVVAGRFDGKPVETRYFTATPFRRDGGFWIRVDAKDARPSGEFKVSRVIGRTFEQAYLFTGPKGEWRVLPLCWSLERQQWDLTHRVLDDISGGISVGEDYDTREKIFNDGCGQCHATQYDIGYNTRTDSYASKMLEGAVACESCHGPGSAHVAWHQQKRQPGVGLSVAGTVVASQERPGRQRGARIVRALSLQTHLALRHRRGSARGVQRNCHFSKPRQPGVLC